MALNYDRLMVLSAVPTGTASAVYTNPSGLTTYIGTILVHNTTGASVTVTLYYVPAATNGSLGTVTTTTEFAKFNVATLDTILFEPKYPFVLPSVNDAIFAIAGASGVNIQCLGSTGN